MSGRSQSHNRVSVPILQLGSTSISILSSGVSPLHREMCSSMNPVILLLQISRLISGRLRKGTASSLVLALN